MPFDTMTLAAVTDEVRAALLGGRIQRIIQPSAASVSVSIFSGGEERWLVLSADAQYGRVQLSSTRLAKAFDTPSPFVMLLRKHLSGARLTAVEQAHGERSLTLVCHRADQDLRLVAEVMGRHSNVILVAHSDLMLGALKIVSSRLSRVRPIKPGVAFHPPPPHGRDISLYPPGARVDPCADPRTVRAVLSGLPAGTPVRAALLGLLPGCGPFLADQIALQAGVLPNAPLEQDRVECVVEASGQLYRLYETRDWRPHTFVNARQQPDFAAFLPLGMADVRESPSMSLAIEHSWGQRESRDTLQASRGALLTDIERARQGVARKLESLREGLEAAQHADTLKERGQLLLAYQHSVLPGSSELSIPELDVTVPFDATLSPVENAERLFRRYRKLRDARHKLPALLVGAEREAQRLDDVAVFARLATSEADVRELRRDLTPRSAEPTVKKRRRDTPKRPARYSYDGYEALVGQNARENEELTFHLARRDDLWLHARERTGAHVVLRRSNGDDPPDHVVHAAAGLAAYFSEGRSDSRVDVDLTLARDVRKISGGPPGRVSYRSSRTVRVEPSLDPWQRT